MRQDKRRGFNLLGLTFSIIIIILLYYIYYIILYYIVKQTVFGMI